MRTMLAESSKKESLFAQAVYRVVREIAPGHVLSYVAVARAAHFPRASRAVGTLMKKNFDPTIPCHRVIHSDGTVGQYNRGTKQKQKLLRAEGVVIIDGKVIV